MLKAIQKFLITLFLLVTVLFLAYQALMYSMSGENMPTGMSMAGVDVSNLTAEEALEKVESVYFAPITLHHAEESIEIQPATFGYSLQLDAALAEAEAYKSQKTFMDGYIQYLFGRTLSPIEIAVQATYDQATLRSQLENIVSFLDKPPTAPSLVAERGSYAPGQPGYLTDIDASLALIEQALLEPNPTKRQVNLVVVSQPALEMSLSVLGEQIRRELVKVEGMLGSIFVMDLRTGEELSINADVPLSGLSILKIGIFIEAYRALDRPPNEYEQNLFYETAVLSSNYGANLLLHIIAGEDNTYQGAAVLTESFQRLGLVNTFMAIPYDANFVPNRPQTYVTPANSQPNIPTRPDIARQTTAEDMGTLLSMLYYCSKGGGALLAIYPGQVTPEECQAIIDLMVQNVEGNLIRLGVPEDVPVSHKHGWGDGLTHGDAGIVFSPGGDYVIVTYLHQPSGFIVSDYSFPVLWEISRLTYNYFNYENPHLDDLMIRAEREGMAREAALATATAQALEAEAGAAATVEATPASP